MKTLRLTNTERAMFGVFARSFGRFLSSREIVDGTYANDPNGGPINADNCIAVALVKFRKKLGAVGLEIDAVPGPGGGRRMVWAKTGRAAKK
ncbi:hypothetical protein [Mesorhizobium sp. M0296]|uniref:hypothetical protein n=1 Tax=Mesorhizobium sp. M0296 TaxID=2956931 RepID=UPI003338A0FB